MFRHDFSYWGGREGLSSATPFLFFSIVYTVKTSTMALTKKDIQHIAKLARLDLSAAEEERFSNQLSSILDYVSQLQEVDTAGVAYEYPVEGLRNITQEDAVMGCDDDTRRRLLEAMPEKAGDFLKVKGVFSS